MGFSQNGIIHAPYIEDVAQPRGAAMWRTAWLSREFFHGKSVRWSRSVKWFFPVAAFALPVFLLAAGVATASMSLLVAAFIVQFAGLVAERWFFFAQARHPQNLYYQAIS
jgi:sulfite dehydrogenase (quinone) subunit SoeC